MGPSAGFTSGDGSFKVSIRVSKSYKVGGRVIIIFVLTQHIRDELLLKSIINFFGPFGVKLILIRIILNLYVSHSKITMEISYHFSVNTLSLV